MAGSKVCFLLALLASVNVILAQEQANNANSSPENPQSPPSTAEGFQSPTPSNDGGFQFPPPLGNEGHFERASFFGFPLDAFASFFQGLGGLGGSSNSSGFQLPFASLFNSRDQAVHPSFLTGKENSEPGNGPHERFFFHTRLAACNYTSQPGNTCYGCRVRLNCLPSNIGFIRSCPLFLPYCNGGVCSYVPNSALCNSTTV